MALNFGRFLGKGFINVGRLKYYSITPSAFQPKAEDTDFRTLGNTTTANLGSDNSDYIPINLPHGANIHSCVIYGGIATENWTLYRTDRTGSATSIGLAAVNTIKSNMRNTIVDNLNYSYYIKLNIDTLQNSIFYGGWISYTEGQE